MDISKSEMTPLIFVSEAFMIDAQKMKNCRMKVVNVNGVLRDIVTVIVRGPVGGPALAPAASHPHRETAPVMVPAEVAGIEPALTVTSAPKFAAPDHKGVIQ